MRFWWLDIPTTYKCLFWLEQYNFTKQKPYTMPNLQDVKVFNSRQVQYCKHIKRLIIVCQSEKGLHDPKSHFPWTSILQVSSKSCDYSNKCVTSFSIGCQNMACIIQSCTYSHTLSWHQVVLIKVAESNCELPRKILFCLCCDKSGVVSIRKLVHLYSVENITSPEQLPLQ